MVPVIGNLGTVTFIWMLNNHAKMPDLVTGTSTLIIPFSAIVMLINQKISGNIGEN